MNMLITYFVTPKLLDDSEGKMWHWSDFNIKLLQAGYTVDVEVLVVRGKLKQSPQRANRADSVLSLQLLQFL